MKGIIALSACLAGEVARYLQRGMYEDGEKGCPQISGDFRRGEFFSGTSGSRDSRAADWSISSLLRMHQETGIELVATNDVHYTYADRRRFP